MKSLMAKVKKRVTIMANDTREQRILDGVDAWAGYYRANPHRFAKDYLKVRLKLFQKILLYMMNVCNFFCYIAARGWQKILHIMASPHSNMRAISGQNR